MSPTLADRQAPARPAVWSAATITERATAILSEELDRGALANVTKSNQRGAMLGLDPLGLGAASQRLHSEAQRALDTLLQLLAPTSAPGDGRSLVSSQQAPASLVVLRSARLAPPGQSAEIRSQLRNESPQGVDLTFICSDLIAAAGQYIAGDCLQLHPQHVWLEPGGLVSLTIALNVPANTPAGVYHALLEPRPLQRLRALLTFPIGFGSA